MIENNPLKQYFRRPALYLKLPSGGKYYPEGTLDLPPNGEIPIYPMTAIDEITAKTPDALFNGVAVTQIIKSCVPNIKDPWYVPSMDLDPILIAIRSASVGAEMELESTCPSCKEETSYNINLTGLLTSLNPKGYNEPLMIGELEIKFKPLSFQEVNAANMLQFELQRSIYQIQNITDDDEKMIASSKTIESLNDATFTVEAETIEYIKTPSAMVTEKEYILDFLKNCDRNVHELIKKTSIELREGAELKPLKVQCPSCSHNYEQNLILNVSDFFE